MATLKRLFNSYVSYSAIHRFLINILMQKSQFYGKRVTVIICKLRTVLCVEHPVYTVYTVQ